MRDKLILIGIGGNLASLRFGAPLDTLTAALVALEAEGIQVATRSAWYRTEPVPRSDQPWFVNAVASLTTHLAARDLLMMLQAVEGQFGRVRSERNAARVIDLDLLDYRGQVTETSSLVLPHPRLHQRRFVLQPLAEIAPDWRHPLSGLTAEQLLSRLVAKQPIERLPC
ncbi:MAG TPA: 2-amino-4-hydroxy-6-hydroxymethyldihydropteridine diphosphokinase [Stellaceae bacterium]|jgi:2-amino-4-hydroxy-6-hydroxymethyldihydropteridine diphosphokinase|nr:2-amino-4-hydroxy-6-hydroxymethyldihydropteridine diphosphokinase [Stellaceae bacterium]